MREDARQYKDTTAVVVGASGFIGRWVVRKLVDQGAQVCPVGRADTEKLGDVYRRVQPSITFNLAGYGTFSDFSRKPRIQHQRI